MDRATLKRFFSKVSVAENGCWEWQAYRNDSGHGRFWYGDRLGYAHRFSHELFKGAIPDGLTIDHLCRNPPCLNPDHLEAVTQGENVLRGDAPPGRAVRATHCKNGHAWDLVNTRWGSEGHRECRACGRAKARRRKEREKAA